MITSKLATLWYLLLLLAAPVAGAEDTASDLQQRALRGTVQIVATTGDKIRTGTGAVVGVRGDELLVLTAEHVVRPARTFRVVFWPHDNHAPSVDGLNVIKAFVLSDLALVTVPAPTAPPKPLSIHPLADLGVEKFRTLTIGCSDGNAPSCEFPSVEDAREAEEEGERALYWVTDTAPVGGRSGGPMLDEQGWLVGVCSGSGNGKGFFAHIREIHRLCDAAGMPSLYRNPRPTGPYDAPRMLRLISAVAQQESARWVDPGDWEMRADLLLTVELQDDSAEPFPVPVTFDVRCEGHAKLVGDSGRFSASHPGRVQIPVTIELRAQSPETVGLVIAPARHVPLLSLEPTQFKTAVQITPPPPLVTTVTARVERVGPAEWVDLTEGVASFAASVHIHVDGPLGDRTALGLEAPPGVRSLDLSQNVIRPGEQTLQIGVRAVVAPSPRRTHFDFRLRPAKRGAIDVRVAQDIHLSVQGPPPARLVLAQGRIPQRVFEVSWPADGPSATILTVTPLVLNVPDPGVVRQLALRLDVDEPLRWDAPADVRPSQAVPITVRTSRRPLPTSFFKDSVVRTKLTVSSVRPTPAVAGSEHIIAMRRPAPFKRLLLIIGIAVFVALALYLPFRLFASLNSGVEIDELAVGYDLEK